MPHSVALISTVAAGLGLALAFGLLATRVHLPALVGYLVAGIVMVDGVSEYLPGLGTPVQNAAWERDSAQPSEPGGEGILILEAIAAVKDAPPLPKVPAIVLSADKFAAPEALTPENYTLAQIHEANDMLASALGTTNVIATGTGHNMMLYQPKFVADTIIGIVDQVRRAG